MDTGGGTCESGFMGSMNPDDENYFTCHLTIKVPSEGERNTVLYMVCFLCSGRWPSSSINV